MIPYGMKKIKHKIHSHNKCSICVPHEVKKKRARREAKEEIRKYLFIRNNIHVTDVVAE